MPTVHCCCLNLLFRVRHYQNSMELRNRGKEVLTYYLRELLFLLIAGCEWASIKADMCQ